MTNKPEILNLSDGNFIAYHKTNGKKNKPGIIFLGGFMSDMSGTKATALDKFCADNDYSFIRFDYLGHGKSSGKFTDFTIGKWKQNVIDVIDNLAEGPQILIGSSMGGWLMLLAALERKEKIAGLIGIASAPDFTEKLIWEKLNSDEQKTLTAEKIIYQDSDYGEPYPITIDLIEEAREHLLLDNDTLPIDCPVRLLHGMLDKDVPYNHSVKLGDILTSDNFCLNLVPKGDHSMSSDENLDLLCSTLDDFLEKTF